MSIPSHRRSPTKMQDHRAKGLCFNCDDKFNLGHRAEFQLRLKLKRLVEEKEKSHKLHPQRKRLKLALHMPRGKSVVLCSSNFQNSSLRTMIVLRGVKCYEMEEHESLLELLESRLSV